MSHILKIIILRVFFIEDLNKLTEKKTFENIRFRLFQKMLPGSFRILEHVNYEGNLQYTPHLITVDRNNRRRSFPFTLCLLKSRL